MGCFECNRLCELFAATIHKNAELRERYLAALAHGDLIAVQAIEQELKDSTAEIAALRRQLLDHEAAHRDPHRIPTDEGQSSNA
jgi:hypothetical protein